MDFGQNYFEYMDRVYRGDEYQQPFYETYPLKNHFSEEAEYERDCRRLQEMYPVAARKVQEYVKDACDRMEYEGSAMFDEYPDKYTLQAICRKIYRKVNDLEELKGTSCCQDPVYQMIEVMLIHEIFNRRCRYRRCRRRYW